MYVSELLENYVYMQSDVSVYGSSFMKITTV